MKLDDLSSKEKRWIATQLENAKQFVETFVPQESGEPVRLAALDKAFAAWVALTPTPTDVASINAIVNCVGVAFGGCLVDGLQFQWVIATDAQGSDLAVHALPGKGDVLIYPANFVAKRWERREVDFLQKSYQQIASKLQSLTEISSQRPIQ